MPVLHEKAHCSGRRANSHIGSWWDFLPSRLAGDAPSRDATQSLSAGIIAFFAATRRARRPHTAPVDAGSIVASTLPHSETIAPAASGGNKRSRRAWRAALLRDAAFSREM